MNRPTITLAAWLALCACAHAASPQDVANPAAPVPPVTYESPLARFPAVQPDTATPAANWRAANAAVAGQSGHATHTNHDAAKPTPAADPHAGHHMAAPAPEDAGGKAQDAHDAHQGHEGQHGQSGHAMHMHDDAARPAPAADLHAGHQMAAPAPKNGGDKAQDAHNAHKGHEGHHE